MMHHLPPPVVIVQVADETYAPCRNPYALDGTATQAEVATATQGLAWPQEGDDVRGLLGAPLHYTATMDYWAIEGQDDKWLVLTYDLATGNAVGAQVVNREGCE